MKISIINRSKFNFYFHSQNTTLLITSVYHVSILPLLPYPEDLVASGTYSPDLLPRIELLLIPLSPLLALLARLTFGLIIIKKSTDGISSKHPYSHHQKTAFGGATTLKANPILLDAKTNIQRTPHAANRNDLSLIHI